MSKRILHVVTNVEKYAGSQRATGLWLGELTHAYDEFEKKNYLQDIVSPNGGLSPLEPKSLGRFVADRSVMARKHDPEFVMFDFLDNQDLQRITQNIYEDGGIVSAVCHGYCGLLNVKLSNGKYLIDGRKMTGFTWTEEILAGVAKEVPYNAEEMAKKHGADFSKCLIPLAPHVVADGTLITGQNPFSAKKTALAVIQTLENMK